MFTMDEGCKNCTYKDTTGNTTVGIGFNMDTPSARRIWDEADIPESFDSVKAGTQLLSQESIWALLNMSVANCKQDLHSIFPSFDTYPIYVQLALINLCFNLGKPTFSTFTTFLSRIRLSNFKGAAQDLALTKWATQVPNRAMRVCALLNNDDSLYNV
jgi:GH24 family phage-related lysozyme (muramidase)